MGRPEGAGCYCAANSLLTLYLEKLIDNYSYVVMDNEAGMEHISRLTTNDIDLLLVVSDPTRRGIQAAARIVELTQSLGLNIERKYLIINQSRTGQGEAVFKAVNDFGLDLIGMVPEDSEVRDFDLNGQPTVELVNENKAVKAAYEIFEKIFET